MWSNRETRELYANLALPTNLDRKFVLKLEADVLVALTPPSPRPISTAARITSARSSRHYQPEFRYAAGARWRSPHDCGGAQESRAPPILNEDWSLS